MELISTLRSFIQGVVTGDILNEWRNEPLPVDNASVCVAIKPNGFRAGALEVVAVELRVDGGYGVMTGCGVVMPRLEFVEIRVKR